MTQIGKAIVPPLETQPIADPNRMVPSEGIAVPEANPAAQPEATTAPEAEAAAQPEPTTEPEAPAVTNFTENSDESTGQPETIAVAKPTETCLTTESITAPNADVVIEKVSFGRCILNERCRGPKRYFEEQCPGCKNYIHHICGRVLYNDEDGYKEGDVLCPTCDKRFVPALLCLPVTQYDEDTSESGEDSSYVDDEDQCCCGCGQDASGSCHYCLYIMKHVGEEDGYLSYCLQCYGKVAQGRKKIMMKRRRNH